MNLHEIVEATANGVVVAVHVQPRSGATAITGRHGDALRIRVTAPPVDGRATEAARRALADALDVSAATVELVSGERSRLKRFRVDGLTLDEARDRIAGILAG
jgi:uncharacterized protein (TIGR00251 family)